MAWSSNKSIVLNILITAASSAQAHSLKSKLGKDNILLGDHLELPGFMLSSGNMIRLPDPTSTSYTHETLTLCLDNHIDAIYMLRGEEAKLLLEAEQLFKEFNISLISEV